MWSKTATLLLFLHNYSEISAHNLNRPTHLHGEGMERKVWTGKREGCILKYGRMLVIQGITALFQFFIAKNSMVSLSIFTVLYVSPGPKNRGGCYPSLLPRYAADPSLVCFHPWTFQQSCYPAIQLCSVAMGSVPCAARGFSIYVYKGNSDHFVFCLLCARTISLKTVYSVCSQSISGAQGC